MSSAEEISSLSPPPPLQVAIIGAGVCGMATAKACLDQGLRVMVFEQTNHLAGLWRYDESVSEEGLGSVMHSTVVNSSKEMTAFSDWPVPEDYPNFMTNKWMVS